MPTVDSFEALCDRTFVEIMAEVPETAALFDLGEAESRADSDALTDHSPAGSERRWQMMRAALDTVNALPAADSAAESRSRDVFRAFLTRPTFEPFVGVEGREFLYHHYPVTQDWGVQSELPMFFLKLHPLRNGVDARRYAARIARIPHSIEGVIEGLRLRQERGIVAPRPVLRKALAEIDTFLAPPPRKSLLYTTFAARLKSIRDLDVTASARLLDRVEAGVGGGVYTAYSELRDLVARQAAAASEEPGVWRLPDGEAFYRYQLRCQTSTELTPQQVHELGLVEMGRLQEEIRQAFADLGRTGADIARHYSELEREERFRWPAGEEGRRRILHRCEELLDAQRSHLDDLFDPIPRAAVIVQPTPSFVEAARTTTCYPPARDGSRPGIFEINLAQELAAPTWKLPTLVYHEALPGHHLQFTLAQERQELPLFRRTVLFHAYIEGWAKYAELLPRLSGHDNDPYSHLGRLRGELFSTVNLALDTGIHAERWSREQGIRFFRDNTGVSREFAEYIVDRIAATPAQVCSYKIGLIEVLRLRRQWQRRLGAAFEPKRFHDAVLRHGSVPLDILQQAMESDLEHATQDQ